ncbi:MAG TPA: glycosyltransferase family 2 protein [Flavobacterium sp.]
MLKISIITINYNDAIGLEKTMLSVLNQTNLDFEYIVIDGNSTDGSKEIIQKYQDKLTYWVSESDSGIYNAMNKGINVATGEYLLFMNSGDVLVYDKNILRICEEKLQEDIVAFNCFLERDDKIVGLRTHIEKPTLFYVYKNGLKHQSTFVRKNLFEKMGLYREEYKIASDYEFWIRCFLEPKVTSKGVDIPLAIYKLGGISEIVGWGNDFDLIHKELLPHLITDFKKFEKLLPYQNSRILKMVIKIQSAVKKIFN